MDLDLKKQIKFSTVIGLTTSILVTIATLGVAAYALFS